MSDVVDKLIDLHKQATTERSHYYVASVAKEAIQQISNYRAVLADHNRLVRELDVLLNGVDGAAPQASLCDIVAQLADWRRKQTAENEQ